MNRFTLTILISLHMLCSVFAWSATQPKENQPSGFRHLLNRISPPRIENINSCYHSNKIWVFYERAPFFPEFYVDSACGPRRSAAVKTCYVTWDGTRWSKEDEVDTRIHYVVSDTNEIVALVDDGYRTFKNGKWSDTYRIDGYSTGFACLSQKGFHIFYKRDGNLVERILAEDVLSAENVAQADWICDETPPGFISMGHSRAVYAYDRIWLFSRQADSVSPFSLHYRTKQDGEWTDAEYLSTSLDHCPVVMDGRIYLFYHMPFHRGMPSFKYMVRVQYTVYDGRNWSPVQYVSTGQPSSLNALSTGNEIWLFIGQTGSLKYVRLANGIWGKPRTIGQSISSTPIMVAWLVAQIVMLGLATLIVLLISHLIERKKKVVIQLKGRQYECASLFRRYVASSIDFLLFLLPAVAVFLALAFSEDCPLFESFWVVWSVMTFGPYVAELAYFIVLEAKWGKTLGKLIMRIRVISTEGEPCGLKRALVRNVLRVADGFLYHLVGAIVFGVSDKHQRVGDQVGKTYVILDRGRLGAGLET